MGTSWISRPFCGAKPISDGGEAPPRGVPGKGGYINEATQQTVSAVSIFGQIDDYDLPTLSVADRRIGECLSELSSIVAV